MKVRWCVAEICVDLPGIVFHTIPAIATVILGVSVEATIAYLIYQYVDLVYKREEPLETQGDIIEWLMGLMIGALIRILKYHVVPGGA
jgi:TRAP-type mannitol/chloroaromatic compound transport system permease small subunit